MLRVEDLRRERENPRTAFLQFLLNAKLPNIIHSFFEGQDDLSFYTNFINSFTQDPDKLHLTYICGDKEGVYKAYGLVMKANRPGTFLFFVDKDLSDILNEKYLQATNIYVTEFYSIENYIVTEYMLRRIWAEILHFTEIGVEFSEVYRNKFQ